MKKNLSVLILSFVATLFINNHSTAQGTWNTLTNSAPSYNGGVMILLTDGTVMCLTQDSSGYSPSIGGNTWDLLIPDSTGSYLNGTWTQLPLMEDTRLYCATWVMPDGNVYVAGGEYGTGANTGEIYNTNTHTWAYINAPPPHWQIFDGSAENLYDGTILQGALDNYDFQNAQQDLIFNESNNSFGMAPLLLGSHEEVSWVKMPDSSILNVDPVSEHSERYIPQFKKWIADSNLHNYIMDDSTGETGADFLLPNGKVLCLSDTAYTAIYTPSGGIAKGIWKRGPAMPVTGGVHLGCPDAPAAMMPDGNILCAFSPARTYNPPVYFYEFNYLTNTFTEVSAPGGGDTVSTPAFTSCMLVLPDGTILTSFFGDNNYYQYTPSGSPLASGKPTIDNIISNCPNFKITGKLFNGISEGAAYGDDWQMATNYPIVRITKGSRVYYAKTTNWNRIGAVMTDSLEDTADFVIPPMPEGTYSVQVIANGNASNPYSLTLTCSTLGIRQVESVNNIVTAYPNPSNGNFIVTLSSHAELVSASQPTIEVYNAFGEKIFVQTLKQVQGDNNIDLSNQPNGVYLYRVLSESGSLIGKGKLIIQK